MDRPSGPRAPRRVARATVAVSVAVRAVELTIAAGWGAFWLYWLVAAFTMKRGRVPWSRELRIRAVIVVVALVRSGVFRHHSQDPDPWRTGLGLVLLALGLGFAVWVRVHIGRNWSTPMTKKDEPELLTSGPCTWSGARSIRASWSPASALRWH